MAEERVYIVPLRNAVKTERVFRAKKAVTLVREFLQKHMKSEEVRIGKSINEGIWARGAKKPPRKVRIHTIKEDNVVYAELVGTDIETPSAEDKQAREKKEKEKKEKIKEARKERKQMSIQEEIDESGTVSEETKAASKTIKDTPKEKTTKPAEAQSTKSKPIKTKDAAK